VKSRWLRAALLVVLVAGGVVFYRTTLRPDPRGLAAWAETALRGMFGPHVEHGEMEVDVLRGVRVRGLRVPRLPGSPGEGDAPALSADEVVVQHDPLALLAGVLRLERIVLKGPLVSTHETEAGEIALDFWFEPPRAEGTAKQAPILGIEDGTFRLRSSPASKKFQPDRTLVIGDVNLVAGPDPTGRVRVDGSMRPEGVGLLPGESVEFGGQGDIASGTLEVTAAWRRLRLTEEVKALLAPELRARIDALQIEEGPHVLYVTVRRDPQLEAGRVRIVPDFQVTARLDVGMLPGGETIDARTREQLNDLFDRIGLSVRISGTDVEVKDLAASMAGGELYAQGVIRDGGRTVDIDLRITDLPLDDPALRRLIGEDAFASFRATGTAAATITLKRDAGGPFRWEAAIDLIDATLVYIGTVDLVEKSPSGRPLMKGFPYEIRQCYGRIYADAQGVRFDEIKGRHGRARIRIRGSDEKSRSGDPTGYVRFLEEDTEFRLTIEAQDLAIDADLEAAVEGSEFAGLLDRFRPTGIVDRVLLDIVKRATLDQAAVVELELSSKRIDFVYGDFPILYDVAQADVTILRPVLPDGKRGKEFRVRARGTAAGGETTVVADLFPVERRGRVRVEGRGVRLDGALEQALLASEPGQGEMGDVWRFLRPSGTVDVVADMPAYDDPGPATYDVTLFDAQVTLGDPADPDGTLVVEEMAGRIRVTEDHVAIEEVVGKVADAPVTLTGTLEGGTEGRWDVQAASKDLRVTRGLLHVIEQSGTGGTVLPAGIEIRPGGRMDLDVRLRREPILEPENPPPLVASVVVRRADVVARLGELEMRVRGGFSVDGEDVSVEDLLVEGRGIEIRIPKARVGPEGLRGALTARLTDVRMGPEVLGLLPEGIRETMADLTKDRLLQASDLLAEVDDAGAMTVRGGLGLTAPARSPPGGAPRGQVEFAPLSVSAPGPKGEREVRGRLLLQGLDLDVGTRIEEVTGALDLDHVRLGEEGEGGDGRATLTLETARVAGLRMKGAVIPLLWVNDLLTAGPLAASVYEGRLSGEVRVHTADPVAFEGRLAVDAISLAELTADLGGADTVRGTATLAIEFQSRGPEMRDLTAAGTATVCDGDLGDLPVIATIPALFGTISGSCNKPHFERAHVDFVVRDEMLEARHIHLAGPIFEMEGCGTLSFSGRVDVTFAPQFIKSFFLPGSLQIPVVEDVLGLLREDPLYIVRVHGPVTDPETTLVPLPFILGRRRGPPEWEPTPFEGRLVRRVPRRFH
jgi:hypothetical protein